MRARWIAHLVIALAIGASDGLDGQGPSQVLGITGRQDLDFGVVFLGMPNTVSRFDAGRSGQFVVDGAKTAQVRVDFVLPTNLVSALGDQIPLVFGAGDGGYSTTPSIKRSQAFDPVAPLITTLHRNGRLYLFLGGTANPAAQQRAGLYSATISVTVSYTGV